MRHNTGHFAGVLFLQHEEDYKVVKRAAEQMVKRGLATREEAIIHLSRKEKKCQECGEWKPRSEFVVPDGYTLYRKFCLACSVGKRKVRSV